MTRIYIRTRKVRYLIYVYNTETIKYMYVQLNSDSTLNMTDLQLQ